MNRTGQRIYSRQSPITRQRLRRRKIMTRLAVLLVLVIAAVCLIVALNRQPETQTKRIRTVQGELVDAPATPPKIAEKIAKKRAEKEALDAYHQAVAEGKARAVSHPAHIPALYVADGVKTAYLTFDDGPSSVTGQILDVLKAHDIKATFFMLGSRAEHNQSLVKRVYDEGHSIGNHSYSHEYGKIYASEESFIDELNRTREAINAAIGGEYQNLIFRFPGGSFEDYKKPYRDTLLGQGYQYVDWNALNGDSEMQSPDRDYLMQSLKTSVAGREDVVVLMHDASAKKVTADTLEEMIAFLEGEGYMFRPLVNTPAQ